MSYSIDINIVDDFFIINGDTESLLQNKRLLISLKRLNYFIEKNSNIPSFEDIYRAHGLQARQIIPFESLAFLRLNNDSLEFDIDYFVFAHKPLFYPELQEQYPHFADYPYADSWNDSWCREKRAEWQSQK